MEEQKKSSAVNTRVIGGKEWRSCIIWTDETEKPTQVSIPADVNQNEDGANVISHVVYLVARAMLQMRLERRRPQIYRLEFSLVPLGTEHLKKPA